MDGINFEILGDKSLPQVTEMLHKLTGRFHFDNGSYGVYSLPNSQVIATTTLPMSWIQIYLQNNFFSRDPAIQVPIQANRPLDWRLLEELDTVGFFPLYYKEGHGNFGISIPFRGPSADIGLFTFSKNCDTPEEWDHHKQAIMDGLLAEAVEMHSECSDILNIKDRFGIEELSERQISIIQDMAAGKTNRDIAKDLGQAPRTIEQQIRNIRQKLRAETTHQMIAKATAMGFAHPR